VSILPDNAQPAPDTSGNHQPWEVPDPDLQPSTRGADEPREPIQHGASPAQGGVSSQTDEPVAHLEYLRAQPDLFDSYSQPDYVTANARIPNFVHLLLLLLLFVFGWLGAGSVLLVGIRFHAFGVTNLAQATKDFRYTVGSQAIQYCITLAGCLAIFPVLWHQSFLRGIHWNWPKAFRYRGRLISAVLLCFVGAIVNMAILPGPTDAPIDQLFRTPGAAWVLFAFGVTLAPFFEELIFRGFLLPALCTAYDWAVEQLQGLPQRPVDEDGNPRWSLPAMIGASLISSLPFALMHGEQTGWSVGPFSLLICISLILCWVRLGTRSLAASTLVHAGYNFTLFSLMVFGTDGFKHLDKM
jgi:membrane protease YdiL (CAAX protease family)